MFARACQTTNRRITLMDGPSNHDCDVDTPQQAFGSLDCGVVACYVIEQIVRGQKIVRSQWTHEDAGIYRARMVSDIYESIVNGGSVAGRS